MQQGVFPAVSHPSPDLSHSQGTSTEHQLHSPAQGLSQRDVTKRRAIMAIYTGDRGFQEQNALNVVHQRTRILDTRICGAAVQSERSRPRAGAAGEWCRASSEAWGGHDRAKGPFMRPFVSTVPPRCRFRSPGRSAGSAKRGRTLQFIWSL